VKIVFLSDTHNRHNYVDVPDGDVVCHCGDVSMRGSEDEVASFLYWYSNLPHKNKLFIAGNHDFLFEKAPMVSGALLSEYPEVTYLRDSLAEIDGVKFWGSPWQPRFFDWAFNVDRGEAIRAKWDAVPSCDVLLTHGPPQGVLDRVGGDYVGCEELLASIPRIRPKVHAFGHIHENHGIIEEAGVKFVNCALLDERYKICAEPIVLEI